MTSTLACL